MSCAGCPMNRCEGCESEEVEAPSLARPEMWEVACSECLQFGHTQDECGEGV